MPRGFDQRRRRKIVKGNTGGPFRRGQIIGQPQLHGYWRHMPFRRHRFHVELMPAHVELAAIVERPAFALGRHQIPAMNVGDVQIAR